MKPIASRSLFVVTAACLGLASTGCSFVFSRGPDVAPAKMTADTPVKCSASLAPPILDTVLTGTHLVSGVWAATQPDRAFGGSSVHTAVIAADLSLAAIHLLSATYGYYSSSACREAKALEIDFEGARTPFKVTQAEESQARANEASARAIATVDTRRREAFWPAWLPGHEATACPDALGLLTRDSECTGASCRAPLFLSSGYLKTCPIDADARIALSRSRRLWKEAAGMTTSPCLEETFRALEDPAKTQALPERCSGEGKTEAAFRDSVRRSADPSPSSPTKDN